MAWLYFHYLFYFVAASIRISEGSKIEKSCQGKDQASSVCNVDTNDLTASNRQGRQGTLYFFPRVILYNFFLFMLIYGGLGFGVLEIGRAHV